MTFAEAYSLVNPIDGWMGIEDSEVLFGEASKTKGLIVEIGGYKGRSAVLLALASPESEIVVIDPYPQSNGKQIRDEFLQNTKDYNIRLIRQYSSSVGRRWRREIDFLHIDGNHKFRSVKADIDLFAPHLKEGGVAMLHDYFVYGNPDRIRQRHETDANDKRFYNDKHYGVVKAVDQSSHLFRQIVTERGFAKCTR